MTVANTSLLYNLSDRLNRWAQRVGLGGKLAIALTVAAIAAGLTTYAALTGSAPFESGPMMWVRFRRRRPAPHGSAWARRTEDPMTGRSSRSAR